VWASFTPHEAVSNEAVLKERKSWIQDVGPKSRAICMSNKDRDWTSKNAAVPSRRCSWHSVGSEKIGSQSLTYPQLRDCEGAKNTPRPGVVRSTIPPGTNPFCSPVTSSLPHHPRPYNPFPLLPNLPRRIKTRVHLQLWKKKSGWPTWLLIDTL